LAEGKTPLEALRWLRRRLSDVVYRQLAADAGRRNEQAGPGGHSITAFNPREGVDRIWQGEGVIYSQRLSAQRTKSRLSTVMSSPLYKSMTIRSWSTTVKLNNRLSALDASRM